MRIGIPAEIKTLEGRVALIPAACADLVKLGHEVFIQCGAGRHSGYSDKDYERYGVQLLDDAAALYEAAQLVVKVKEPQAAEWDYLRPDHLLFCFLHLAAEPELTRRLVEIGLTAVAFETVETHGRLPLLLPMSIIAGRIAVQVGSHILHRPQGGKGVMLGGLAGTARGKVVVVGAGAAGQAAATLAAAEGAEVRVCDKNPQRLAEMHGFMPNISTFHPYAEAIHDAVVDADLVIGAVLVPGTRAPRIVSRETVAAMTPGSVIADISVDQGGCVETTRATNYADPTYEEEGIIHFAVTNMPGAVPRTSTEALCGAILPYVKELAGDTWRGNPALLKGINVEAGKVVYPALL